MKRAIFAIDHSSAFMLGIILGMWFMVMANCYFRNYCS